MESLSDNFTGIIEFSERAFVRARVEELIREYEHKGMTVHFLGYPFHYSIYVLELLPEVQRERKMIENNRPISDHSPKGFFYVGMTGLPVEQRVQNHLQGYKSCNLVTKYYSGRIFTTKTELTYSEAVDLERSYAEELRTQGYWVYQK
jgi:hypothetical protein